MITKTKILIRILIIGLISVGIVFVLYMLGITPIAKPGPPILGEVIIFTDKTNYEQGEVITVTIKNTLDKSIWYIKEICPPSCCNLYKWEENQWINLNNPMHCVQLVPLPSGKPYPIKPDELKSMGSISKQWDMTIEGKIVESGKYRFSFYYGLAKDFYTEKIIYSNEFTIKEAISQQILDKCKEEKRFVEKIRSDPECLKGKGFRCVDGWGGTTYYDKRLVSTSTIEAAANFPLDRLPSLMPDEAEKEISKATIAVHSQSVCACEKPIGYQILIKDKLEEVTCEEFYRFLQNYESSCGDCILRWSYGCC